MHYSVRNLPTVNHRKQVRDATSAAPCYHGRMFNFGKPKTPGDWIIHIAGAIVALYLIWWMLRVYVL